MPFKIVAKPPLRAPEMLITTAEDESPAPYDVVAPGLYPGETVAELDTGERVAVSVATRRLPSGGGMEFRGWARVIEDDGTTKFDAGGQEMELEFAHSADAGTLQRLGEKADEVISREVTLMMLGEPPTLILVHVDPDAPQPDPATLPEGARLNPGEDSAPAIQWAADVRLNNSIRHAIYLAGKATPLVDVAALLATV